MEFTRRQEAARYLLDTYSLGNVENLLEFAAEDIPTHLGYEEAEWMYAFIRRTDAEDEELILELIQIESGMPKEEMVQWLEPGTREYYEESWENSWDGFDPTALPSILRVFWDMALYAKHKEEQYPEAPTTMG